MDPQSKKELEKLYTFVSSATATTDFYNRVYNYIKYIKQVPLLVAILDKDDKELHLHDLEKLATRPNLQDGENDLDLFVKEMRHMSSGENNFVSHLFFKINRDIFDLLEWYHKDNFQTVEASVMLNGRKKISFFRKVEKYINRHNVIGYDNTDYNIMYIDNFVYWKNLLSDFHSKLLKKIEEHPFEEVVVVKEVEIKKETILELYSTGDITYLNTKGFLKPTSREYKLLQRLVSKNGKTVSHSEIARLVYRHKNTQLLRMDMPDLVRKLKNKLSKLFSEDISNMIKNSRERGYYLDLQDNQEVKFLP
jgi:hypothetical protein